MLVHNIGDCLPTATCLFGELRRVKDGYYYRHIDLPNLTFFALKADYDPLPQQDLCHHRFIFKCRLFSSESLI